MANIMGQPGASQQQRPPQQQPQGMGQLPGRIGNFFQGMGHKFHEGFGDFSRDLKHNFGFDESDIPLDETVYGMNPRKAIWANMFADFAQTAQGGKYQNLAMKTRAQQTAFTADQANKKRTQQIQMMNALKNRDQGSTLMKEAKHLFPNDPAQQQKYIQDARAKSGVNIDMGQDFQTQILKGIMDSRESAVKNGSNIRRYRAMKRLIPELGATGSGAELMTNLRSGFASYGMEDYGDMLDAIGEAAGIDFFSGDQGARELFRALSTQDIIGRARELYPVSNSDIQLLKQMAATLSGQSDPKAMEVLIDNLIEENMGGINQYNWMRNLLPEGIPKPPEINIEEMDLKGLDGKKARLQELRDKYKL